MPANDLDVRWHVSSLSPSLWVYIEPPEDAFSGLQHVSTQPKANDEFMIERPINIWPGSIASGIFHTTILIFLKWYSITEQKLEGLKSVHADPSCRLGDLKAIVADLITPTRIPKEAALDIVFYKEVYPNVVRLSNSCTTLSDHNLKDGDVVCLTQEGLPERYIAYDHLMIDHVGRNC